MAKTKRHRQERGQALVEFSLVATMFFLLLIGITDLARLYFSYSSMSNAVREGCRYASINPYDSDGIRDRTENLLVIFGDDPEIDISYPDGSRQMGARIRVAVDCEFTLLILPVPPFRLNANSTMLIETVP